jgi:hypothetical protein
MPRTLLLFLLAVPLARADLFSVSSNGRYEATVYFGGSGRLSITGPSGTENYYSSGLFGMEGGAQAPLVNNFGQVVGYTEGGTSDPAIYFALYGSGGGTANFAAGNGIGWIGIVPDGVGFGSLGWASEACWIDYPCGFGNGQPTNLALSDSGIVTADLVLDPTMPPVFQRWILPHPVPEPRAVLLLLTAIGGALLLRRHTI